MIPIEQTKTVILVPPQLKDNGAPSGLTYVDTKGWAHLRVLIAVGTTDVATSAAPLLQEDDVYNGSYANITSAALSAAIGAADDDKLYAIDVDLTKGRKRYIKCLITAGDGTTGTNLCVLGILSRKKTEDHDGLATAGNLEELVSV